MDDMHIMYRVTYTTLDGRITSSWDMTQEFVEEFNQGRTHFAFWMSVPDDIVAQRPVIVEVTRIETESE